MTWHAQTDRYVSPCSPTGNRYISAVVSPARLRTGINISPPCPSPQNAHGFESLVPAPFVNCADPDDLRSAVAAAATATACGSQWRHVIRTEHVAPLLLNGAFFALYFWSFSFRPFVSPALSFLPISTSLSLACDPQVDTARIVKSVYTHTRRDPRCLLARSRRTTRNEEWEQEEREEREKNEWGEWIFSPLAALRGGE